MASVKRVFAASCKPGQGPPAKFEGSLVVHRNRLGSIGSVTELNSAFFCDHSTCAVIPPASASAPMPTETHAAVYCQGCPEGDVSTGGPSMWPGARTIGSVRSGLSVSPEALRRPGTPSFAAGGRVTTTGGVSRFFCGAGGGTGDSLTTTRSF